MGSNHEKNGGRKSRDTLPLISFLFFFCLFLMPYFSLHLFLSLFYLFLFISWLAYFFWGLHPVVNNRPSPPPTRHNWFWISPFRPQSIVCYRYPFGTEGRGRGGLLVTTGKRSGGPMGTITLSQKINIFKLRKLYDGRV